MTTNSPIVRSAADTRIETISLIGGGASALFFLKELVASTEPAAGKLLRLFVFEPSAMPGTGIAWNPVNRNFLCNMHVDTVWLSESKPNELKDALGLGPEDKFVTREDVGLYFSKLWTRYARQAAAHGIEVQIVADKVNHVETVIPAGYQLTTDETGCYYTDAVVIATGQLIPHTYYHLSHCKGFHSNPWSFEPTGNEGRTLILGSGLTSIDVTVGLTSTDHNSPIHWASPSGKVAWVRPSTIPIIKTVTKEMIVNEFKATGNRLRLPRVLREFYRAFHANGVTTAELKAVFKAANLNPEMSLKSGIESAKESSTYFSVMKHLDYLIPTVWHLMDPRDKPAFRQFYKTYTRVSFAMPEPNAARVLSWLATGRLSVMGGRFSLFRRNGEFLLEYTDTASRPGRVAYDTVINASGLGTDLPSLAHNNPLVSSLLVSGLATPSLDGGAKCDFNTGQLLDHRDTFVPGLFALNGTFNCGSRLFTNEILEVAQQAQRTAKHCLDIVKAGTFFDARQDSYGDPYFLQEKTA